MRIQLLRPNNDFVSPQVFNRMFTMHGTTMVFFVAMPILFGFANYLVPLMIGARDMAFPRLNAFSFWLSRRWVDFFFTSVSWAGAGFYGAGNAPDVGWWAYAPLTARAFSPGHTADYWTLALLASGFGTIGTAINIIATILCMRCPGMKLNRMPLLRVAQPGHGSHDPACYISTVGGTDHVAGRSIFRRTFLRCAGWRLGGAMDALLLDFWTPGSLHPDHSMLLLSCRKSSRCSPANQSSDIRSWLAATVCIGFVSMSVWAHHMFTVGMNSYANSFFAITTMAVGVPTGIKIFNWLGTMWGGRIQFKLPMLFCIAFLFQFLIAGLTGIMLGCAPFDWQLSFVVFRRCAFPLHAGRWGCVCHLRRNLLLVPEDDGEDAERDTWQTPFLAFSDRVSRDI